MEMTVSPIGYKVVSVRVVYRGLTHRSVGSVYHSIPRTSRSVSIPGSTVYIVSGIGDVGSGLALAVQHTVLLDP